MAVINYKAVRRSLKSLRSQVGSAMVGFIQSGTGAVKRWVQDKLRETVSITDFAANGVSGAGVDPTGVIPSLLGIQAAVTHLESVGGGRLFCPPGTYNLDSGILTISGANITLDAYGAVFENGRISITADATDTQVLGLKLLDSTGVGSNYQFDIRGTRGLFADVTCEKTPASDGYQGYLRSQSSHYHFRSLRTSGSNGVFIMGHDHLFSDCELEAAAGDDAYVLKGGDSTGPAATYNITITGGSVKGHSAILSIGSEVGQVGAAGTYTGLVRNVVVQGVNAYDCQHLAFFKPGALSGDYRNGLIENVSMIGCNLFDETGTAYESGIKLWGGRGSIMRNLKFADCTIRARCDSTSVTRYGLEVRVMDLGDASTIEDIEVHNCSFIDVYDGVDSGVGSAVGNPMDWVVGIELANTSLGTIGRIDINNVFARGTKAGGLVLGASVTGPINLTGCRWRNIAVNPASGIAGGIYASSAVTVRDADISVSTSQAVGASALTSTQYNGDLSTSRIGTIAAAVAAGAATQNSFWTAPKDCYVWKIELVNSVAISKSDTDYSTYEFRNMSTGNVLVSATTQNTGGITVPDDTPVSVSSTTLVGANAYFPKGTVLRFAKTDTNAGRAITNMYGIVHYVPYGR